MTIRDTPAEENRGSGLPANRAVARSPHEVERLAHELHVHQIELEMQNEELRRAQGGLETAEMVTGLRTFLTTKFPLFDGEGRLYAVCGSSVDITDRKEAEREIAHRNEELERFDQASVGRELRMIALKREVNALSRELGRPPPYDLAFANEPNAGGERP